MNKLQKFVLTLSVLAGINAFAAAENPPQVDVQFIKGDIDLANGLITLPLHVGALKDGRKIYFVLTNTNNLNIANELGIGYSPSLAMAANVAGTRSATLSDDGSFVFDAGTVDFSPVRSLVPGDAPNAFPPKEAHAGAVGDAEYSPFVQVGDDVYNAPILAFDVDAAKINFPAGNPDYTLVHDKVVKIDTINNLVTLRLTSGFASGRSVVYFSFDANVEVAATMESAVFAPALENLKGHNVGLNIYALANGATGISNPDRQGFDSALMGEGSPLNILEGLPTLTHGYSPLWDLSIGFFTADAIANGQQKLIKDDTTLLSLVNDGDITGSDGSAFGPSGIEINCPVVATLK